MFENRKVKSLRRIGTYTWKKKKNILVILLMVFSFLAFSSLSINIGSGPEDTNPIHFTNRLAVVTNNVVEHSPITITGDTELAKSSTSGDGSTTNPYIIENFVINCAFGKADFNNSGIGIRNTDKYFILRNIQISSCGIGIEFSNVTFGSIMNSYAYNNVYFGILLNSSSNNNMMVNNTETGSNIGFEVVSSNYNTLINNTADNNIMGFGLGGFLNAWYWGAGGANNTVLVGNTAVNNGFFGFTLADSSNNLLENNIANHNGAGDYFDNYFASRSSNNRFINNKFVIVNNGLSNSLASPLISTENIIASIMLIGIYSALGYTYYSSSQKKKVTNDLKIIVEEQPKIIQRKKTVLPLPLVFGIIGSILDVLCILFLPYMVVDFNNFSYNTSITANIFQLSPLSGLLLLGGGVLVIGSILISNNAKYFTRYKDIKQFLLIGVITQITGIILALLAYYNVINTINAIQTSAGSVYIAQELPLSGFLVLGGGVLVIGGFIILIKAGESFYEDKITGGYIIQRTS